MFIQTQYLILSLVTIVILIVSKVELAHFDAPALRSECFAVIKLRFMSSPFTLYTDNTHKE